MVAGLVRRLYTSKISKKRPSRGDSLSAAMMRYVGWPLRPIRRKRIRTMLTYSFRLFCVSDRQERVVCKEHTGSALSSRALEERSRAEITGAYFTRERRIGIGS